MSSVVATIWSRKKIQPIHSPIGYHISHLYMENNAIRNLTTNTSKAIVLFAYAFVSCVYKYTAHMAKAFMVSCVKAFIRLLSRLLRVQYFDPIPKLLLRTLNALNMLIYQVSSLDSKGFTTTL